MTTDTTTDTTTDKGPAYVRLHTMSVKHLVRLLGKAWKAKGITGFDPYRDSRTNTKDLLVAYLRETFLPAEIEAAHNEACADYGPPNKRFRRSRLVAPHNNPVMPSTIIEDDVTELPVDAPDVPPYVPPTIPTPSVAPTDDKSAQIARLLSLLAAPQLDEARVAAIVQDHIARTVANLDKRIEEAIQSAKRGATLVEIKTPELPPVELGIQHHKFPTLLKMCNARMRNGQRLNIWVAGPAGVGKTHAAEGVAKALNLPFYSIGAIDQAYKLIGFRDANGNYAPTGFRQAWEHGGVFLFDEIDSSGPNAVLELNSALANGFYPFPDQVAPIKRHPDCVILAGANTFGNGGTAEFNGRMKQDAAFMDRFVLLDFPLDEDLEAALCNNNQWTAIVQSTRARVKAHNIKGATITPRATLFGEALIAAGLDLDTVKSATLRKGMTDETWSKVRG